MQFTRQVAIGGKLDFWSSCMIGWSFPVCDQVEMLSGLLNQARDLAPIVRSHGTAFWQTHLAYLEIGDTFPGTACRFGLPNRQAIDGTRLLGSSRVSSG